MKIEKIRWILVVSAALWMMVTTVAMHTFSTKLYSSPALLGLASGLGAIAALWLTYGLARPR